MSGISCDVLIVGGGPSGLAAAIALRRRFSAGRRRRDRHAGLESGTIDPEGKVKDVFRKVKPAEHDKLVLDALGG